MKKMLKNLLTERQIMFLRAVRRGTGDIFRKAMVSLINAMPSGFLLAIKSNAEIVKKMDYKERDIFLNINSDIEYRVRLHSCAKEPEMITWIQDFMKEGDVLYDVGANVGAYSLVASKYFNGRVRVYAFEPGFMTFVELCRNIITNECQDSIIPLQVALSDKTVMDTFNYNNLTPGGALHAFGKPLDCKGETFAPVFRQPVLSYRIDDLIKQFGIPAPNHIKIDVDGIEYKVLEGASGALKSAALRSVIAELEEGSAEADRIIGLMSRNGFIVHSRHRYTYGGNDGPYAAMHNYIFKR
ncbi:MAG: FkbM family methyltransferase [Candidatus Omnitrophica bacterium]|nr:FkbM family methyltransferase [Candidatus Omnitrophota bacterium]